MGAFFGWLAISEFAGAFVSAFLTLTACAISITLCCALQGVFKLSARTDFVLQFGEDAEARAEPAQVEQIVCANAVPVASVASPAIANLESAEMAELVTQTSGDLTAGLPVAMVEVEMVPTGDNTDGPPSRVML